MPASNLQLPHLVSFCTSFELNTNRHCRAVTIASKKWATQSPYLDHDDRQALAGLRPALLASLCYPTCDAAQLQFVTEVVIVMVRWLDKPKAAGDDRFIEQYVFLPLVLQPHVFPIPTSISCSKDGAMRVLRVVPCLRKSKVLQDEYVGYWFHNSISVAQTELRPRY